MTNSNTNNQNKNKKKQFHQSLQLRYHSKRLSLSNALFTPFLLLGCWTSSALLRSRSYNKRRSISYRRTSRGLSSRRRAGCHTSSPLINLPSIISSITSKDTSEDIFIWMTTDSTPRIKGTAPQEQMTN